MLWLECRNRRKEVMQWIFPSFFGRFKKEDIDSNREDFLRGQSTAKRIRRLPTIAITVVAFFAVFAVLVGDGVERCIYTFAGNGQGGAGGGGAPATGAQIEDVQRGVTMQILESHGFGSRGLVTGVKSTR